MNIANPTDLSTSQLTEEQEIYKENIIDHYKHPRNKKELENATHKENGINPMCGDHITIYLIIKDNKIEEITFTGDGCAISQASVSLLTDELVGKDLSKHIKHLEDKMNMFASKLEFEDAARIRDEINRLKAKEVGLSDKILKFKKK